MQHDLTPTMGISTIIGLVQVKLDWKTTRGFAI
jgi:hypothetical protein